MYRGYRGFGASAVGGGPSGLQARGVVAPSQPLSGASSRSVPSVPGLTAPMTSVPGLTAPMTSVPGLTASTVPGLTSTAAYADPLISSAGQAAYMNALLDPMTRGVAGIPGAPGSAGAAGTAGMFPGLPGGGPLPSDVADAAALETILEQISDSVAGDLHTSFSYAIDDLVEADDHGHIIDHEQWEDFEPHFHEVFHDEDPDLIQDYTLPHPSLRGAPLQSLGERVEKLRRAQGRGRGQKRGKSKFGGQKKPCGCPQYGMQPWSNAPAQQGGVFGDSFKIGAGLALGVFAIAGGAMILAKAIK